MNKVVEDMMKSAELLGSEETLRHYGVSKLDGAPGRGSGRYPLGSGEEPNQRYGDFASRVKALRKEGLSDKEVAAAVGCTDKNGNPNTSQLRVRYSLAINEAKEARRARATAMLAQGKSQAEVSRELGIPESTLRSILDEKRATRVTAAKTTADALKELVDQKKMLDIGVGVEREFGVSKERMKQAVEILKNEGYEVYGGGIPTGPGRQTNLKVLCVPGTPHKDIYNYGEIGTVKDYTMRTDEDGSEHMDKKFEYPAALDPSRLMIRYRDDKAPDGHTGVERDGLIEIRRNVPDLDLKGSHYAQVRIKVGDDKFLKGMAVYSDDMPEGVDVIFNTNKTRDQADKVLKSIKTTDPMDPFGSLLREEGGQYKYTDENGERKLGLINKTRQEGDWEDWADTVPYQFLAKQSQQLIEKQLNLTIADKKEEFESLCALDNPPVKRYLLNKFADECDSAAVHLQAAALPRQKYQVLLPAPSMPDNEVFAPNFENGEKVALIRYPHAGTFEIPILTVNNKHPGALAMYGPNLDDAVAINAKNLARLSGADCDGDTVQLIPCNSRGSRVHIESRDQLEGLEDFDPKMEYGATRVTTDSKGVEHAYRDGREFKIMKNTQNEMGRISNLITDMTLRGAPEGDMAAAVRHSMVVIDAEKHKLDYKQSELDNNIKGLKEKYQGHVVDEDTGKMGYGASTLLTRAKSEVRVLRRQGTPKVNPETGELEYKSVYEEYTDKNGKKQVRMTKTTQMAETKDARTLSSGRPQEEAYANYANAMKALANQARLESLNAGRLKYDANANKEYANEVQYLKDQLTLAEMNAPRERKAQMAAKSEVKAIKDLNENLSKKELAKLNQKALARARVTFGAHRRTVNIRPQDWKAIQAGAISDTTLSRILDFTDMDTVRAYATPRAAKEVSSAKQAKIRAMRVSGYTNAEIAKAVGVSPSTVSKYAS